MLKFFNPYVAIGVLVLLAGSTALGFRLGARYEVAQQLEDKALIDQAADAVEDRTAIQISKIKPLHQTIQTKAKETIREVPVYRDCINDIGVERLLDSARAGSEPAASHSVVP